MISTNGNTSGSSHVPCHKAYLDRSGKGTNFHKIINSIHHELIINQNSTLDSHPLHTFFFPYYISIL